MPYLGKTPSQATRKRYYKTASAGDTSVSGTMTVGGTLTFTDGEFVDVSVNGVALVAGTDYNTNTANTIAGLSALAANDQVEIVVYDTFSVFSGDVDSNMSVGGNLSVTGTSTLTGAVTANAGVSIDNITIDGTEIDLSSGDLTIDVAGDIILDTDGADIRLKHAGTEWGRFVDSTNNFMILSPIADKDIIFNGIDGSSEISALTLDMSDAGAATFNGVVKVPNGSASAAAYAFSNDTSTGMFLPSSDTLAFSSGGSERGRIDSNGALLVGLTTPLFSQTIGLHTSSASAGSTAHFNRTGDGGVVRIGSDATEEGSISVSGTTVSYNGGHLSRWSQATDGNRIDGLVKGTVMTNLDKMAVWHHEAQAATLYEDDDDIPEGKKVGDEKTPAIAAYDEDNEQLNCMAVSSVEGDVNVAGVFVNWDDDAVFTADMNVAMTGDMVIRIGKGTTVARGDLLMSAGDGTAKPQDDDIVRSKTIAKVTSTTKSHTYDDGSYLVPCVLMAC